VRERLINRRQQGDLGEASAIEWLTSKRATVLIPFGHSPDYDLVAEVEGALLRVQVKTSTYVERTPHGHGRYQVSLATAGGNQSWTGVTRRFCPSRCDLLFVLVGDGRRLLIPAAEIEGEKGITLGGPKYSAFEIEPGLVIRDLVYGPVEPPVESEPPRGSADVGESGQTVNLVPRAEWVRIPPPPSTSPSRTFVGRFERTRISSCHQVTIPRDAFVPAGFEVGDKLHATCIGPGRVVLERIEVEHAKLTLLDDVA
jgi:hypothetical protein